MTESSNFENRVAEILARHFGRKEAVELRSSSPLVGYLIRKTVAANRGSKSRGSFANLYAIYVLAEDYVRGGFGKLTPYGDYEGAKFTALMQRQRELPFGEKLQNHALNSRLNDEFHKFYPSVESRPIIRDVTSQRYWLNEDVFVVDGVNLCSAVIEIIDTYVAARRSSFTIFIETCHELESLGAAEDARKAQFIATLLRPNVDARIFEIVAFAIMKSRYGGRTLWIGFSADKVEEQPLTLYKTGRTNANDGGIDFVMRPLGRFFQVTETLDLKKYFLDIDKIQRFPITFVIKSELPVEEIRDRLRRGAEQTFRITRVVESYMEAVEEIINIPLLLGFLQEVIRKGRISLVMQEIIVQSRVEFNLDEDEEAMLKADAK